MGLRSHQKTNRGVGDLVTRTRIERRTAEVRHPDQRLTGPFATWASKQKHDALVNWIVDAWWKGSLRDTDMKRAFLLSFYGADSCE